MACCTELQFKASRTGFAHGDSVTTLSAPGRDHATTQSPWADAQQRKNVLHREIVFWCSLSHRLVGAPDQTAKKNGKRNCTIPGECRAKITRSKASLLYLLWPSCVLKAHSRTGFPYPVGECTLKRRNCERMCSRKEGVAKRQLASVQSHSIRAYCRGFSAATASTEVCTTSSAGYKGCDEWMEF